MRNGFLCTMAVTLAMSGCMAAGPEPVIEPALPPAPDQPAWIVEARAAALEEINRARVAAGLAPLRPDGRLERLGDAFCAALAASGAIGHVAGDGAPPYLRAALAGVYGFHRQNVGAYDSSRPIDQAQVPAIVVNSVRDMLAEQPPHDGHRQTLLDPLATHIGVGVALAGGRVRSSHEVERRAHSRFAAAAPATPAGRPASLQCRLVAPWRVAAVEIGWEPLPEQRTADAPPVRSYSYPPERSMAFASNRNESDGLTIGLDGGLSFTWRTSRGPGIETATVWARRNPGERELTAIAFSSTVVTPEGDLPERLQRWLLGTRGPE